MSLKSDGTVQLPGFRDRLVKPLFFRVTVTFGILILLSVAAWLIIAQQHNESQLIEQQKISALDRLTRQINTLRIQATLHVEYGERYKTLVQEGVIRQQNRVLWVDSMVNLQRSLVMPEFNFKFSPETELGSEHFNTIKIDKAVYQFSRLELKMDLQHEADLLSFLNAFSHQVTPLFLLERCHTEVKAKTLEQRAEISFNPKNANIKVDCALTVFHPHSLLAI